MKTKHLKKILIEKSNEVHIKDLSSSIISRAEKEVILLPKMPKSKWIIDYRLSFSLGLVILIVAFFAIFSPRTNTMNYYLSLNEEEIILSTISSLQIGTSDIIQLTSLEEDTPLINEQVPQMNDYFLWMELLFSTEAPRFSEKENPMENAIRHYVFKSNALDDQSIDYEMVILEQQRKFRSQEIKGIILVDDDEYVFHIIFNNKRTDRSITVDIRIDEETNIKTTHQRSIGERSFSITATKNDDVISEFALTRKIENQRIVLDLTVIRGNIQGSYRFRRDNGALSIVYSIMKEERSEHGTIRVEIIEEEDEKRFQIQVTPQGRDPFEIEVPRPPVTPNKRRGPFN